ncbi:hypothetical protein [Leifsonia aquatica]|uniref:hypothetical protein n=1 Tax=Leifsonia aquatica TaxID=144185 RepID=UPI0038218CBB
MTDEAAPETPDSHDDEGTVEVKIFRLAPHKRLGAINVPRPPIFPGFKVTESMVKSIFDASAIAQANQRLFADMLRPVIALAEEHTRHFTEQFRQSVEFAGMASSIAGAFATQQRLLLESLGPALKAFQGSFYPSNLREIQGLKFESVDRVVMGDGIPLYGVPRASVAEAIIRAPDLQARRDAIGRRWRTISADCRAAVESCRSEAVAPFVPFAIAAVDALDDGHSAAAQALAASVIDTIVTAYFGDEGRSLKPSSRNRTPAAYDELMVREYVAFAPVWQTYQQFRVENGDRIPATFSRHASAHAVSSRQFNRRNAVQGLMLTCSLIYRLDEEARASS